MRGLSNLLRRFRDDERGVFAVLFGVFAIVLIAAAGAVVDFTNIELSRTKAQQALDSAALGLQPKIYNTVPPTVASKEAIRVQAKALLDERLNDTTITTAVTTPTIDTTEGKLRLDGSITVHTAFVALIGITQVTATITAEATRKQLNLEVAMVLDNSISMNQSSRMTNLKKAARCATDVLLNAITTCTDTELTKADAKAATVANVKIAIIPFTEFVNVGTGNKTASWMDQTGASKVHKDNFDNDDNSANGGITSFPSPITSRFTLFTRLNITWSGCVEARNHTTGTDGLYYDTSDLPPDPSIPDSLFSPIFAPDQPDGYSNDYLNDRPSACTNKDAGTWKEVLTKTGCPSTWSKTSQQATVYTGCTKTESADRTSLKWDGTSQTAATTQPATMPDKNGTQLDATCATVQYTSTSVKKNGVTTYTLTKTSSCSYSFSDRVLQERLCKYASGATVTLNSSNFQTGPNADCGVALLPLTSTKTDLISKIGAMGPDGATNIHQGVMWGFHALSKGAPLTEARDYESATSKAMIVMTDGENTHSYSSDFAGANWYTAYGYPYSGRLTADSTTNLQTEMDNRTKATCKNAKDAGITVYTIGLSAPNQTTIDMLTACASEPAKAFFPTDPTTLTATFQKIAQQLSNLRLAK